MMDEPESGLRIVWDEQKARSNLRKHKVSFEEAESVFADPLSITKPDPDHSTTQNRFLTLGLSFKTGSYLWPTDDPDEIRIISARLPTASERDACEND
jgi:uncharacterized DUF497 family protein